MGLLPEEFYKMRVSDFALMKKGFSAKLNYEQAILRKQASIILSPFIKNVWDIMRAWKIEGDQPNQISEATKSVLARLKKGGFTYVKVGKQIVEVPNVEN